MGATSNVLGPRDGGVFLALVDKTVAASVAAEDARAAAAEAAAEAAKAALAVQCRVQMGAAVQLSVNIRGRGFREGCLVGRVKGSEKGYWRVLYYDTQLLSELICFGVAEVLVEFEASAYQPRRVEVKCEDGKWHGGRLVKMAPADEGFGVLFDDGEWTEDVVMGRAYVRYEAARPREGGGGGGGGGGKGPGRLGGLGGAKGRCKRAGGGPETPAAKPKVAKTAGGAAASSRPVRDSALAQLDHSYAKSEYQDRAGAETQSDPGAESSEEEEEKAEAESESESESDSDWDAQAKPRRAPLDTSRRSGGCVGGAKKKKPAAAAASAGSESDSDSDAQAEPRRAPLDTSRRSGGCVGGAKKKPDAAAAAAAETWEMERVSGAKMLFGKMHYKICWKGWGPAYDSWELVRNLCEDTSKEHMAAMFNEYTAGQWP
jgi:hypothetical protein